MFGRHNEYVSADRVRAAQGGPVDPKTVAESEASNIRNVLMLQQVHPWAAANTVQAQLACYAIVYLNDRLAEIMMCQGMTRNRKKAEVLPIRIDAFVHELTGLALERLEFTQEQLPKRDQVSFDEETRAYLYVANNMPDFPEYPPNHMDREKPFGRSINSGTVTVAFVKALNEAGLEVQGRAHNLAMELAEFPENVPSMYSNLFDILRQNYIYGAEGNSRKAANKLEAMAPGTEDWDLLSAAYELAYEGYVAGAFAYTVLHCPALMGPDWILKQY